MSEANNIAAGDRLFSALAHISILLGGVGPIVPAIIWVAKRRKSEYTSFQALQALGYSIFYMFYILLVTLVLLIGFFVLVASSSNRAGAALGDLASLWMVGLFVIAIGLIILPVLLGIAGALVCLFGKEFRYPMLGRRLAGYLRVGGVEGIDLDHEDRYVSAVAHACVMFISPNLPYFIATPLVTLLSSKGRSQLLHFQSLQALVFQLIGTAVSFGILMVMAGMFGLAMILAGLNPITGAAANSGSIPALIMLVAAVLIFLISLLLLPLIQTFGLVAGYRMLKGKEYEYPLVGKLVKGWSWI